jgi:signal peptidase II
MFKRPQPPTISFLALAAVSTLVVIAADQAMKIAARTTLAVCAEPPASACDQVALLGSARLIRVENAGSALGLMQGLSVWVLLAIAGLALVPLYARRFSGVPALGGLAVGLQTGGALGNLVDRIASGSVTDFIELAGAVVFNPADVALVAGMVLALECMRRTRAPVAVASLTPVTRPCSDSHRRAPCASS